MNLILERLKVFLMVMGSVVIVGIGFLITNARIDSLRTDLYNHSEADRVFHDSVVLPMITEMLEKSSEQLEISRQFLRIQCLESDTTDVIFRSTCEELKLH